METAPDRPQIVLIVEDDFLIRIDIADYLRRCGWHIVKARRRKRSPCSNPTAPPILSSPTSRCPAPWTAWASPNGCAHRQRLRIILTSGVVQRTEAAASLCNEGPIGKPTITTALPNASAIILDRPQRGAGGVSWLASAEVASTRVREGGARRVRVERESIGARRGDDHHGQSCQEKKPAAQMIGFSRARDIPFNRIRLSADNVREIDVEAGLDDLTYDIDRREDLVQGLNVRVILDEDGKETGDFETPAGGRRYRSIVRLVEAGRSRPMASSPASSRRPMQRPQRSTTRWPRTCCASHCIRSTS